MPKPLEAWAPFKTFSNFFFLCVMMGHISFFIDRCVCIPKFVGSYLEILSTYGQTGCINILGCTSHRL